MNHPKKDYKDTNHEIWKAICVTSRQAHDLCDTAYIDKQGHHHAETEELHRPSDTDYHGDVLICAEGKTYGLVELTATRYEQEAHDYVWIFTHPRRVIEYDVRCYRGLFDAVFDIGDICEYPQHLHIGADGWARIWEQVNGKKPTLWQRIKRKIWRKPPPLTIEGY